MMKVFDQDEEYQNTHFDLLPRNASCTLILKVLTKYPKIKSEIASFILKLQICWNKNNMK